MMRSTIVSITAGLLGLASAFTSHADQTLVPAGSPWRYLDDGSNQTSSGWHLTDFQDSTWKEGNAELGYGDGDETRVVGFGGVSTSKYITTYFRRTFEVANRAAFLGLKLRLLRDDGAVVYLNGTEVRRDNLPTGTILHTTLASPAVADAAEDTYYDSTVPPSLLRDGTNTLAVEIHQHAGDSSDISFNLELIGLTTAPTTTVTRGPYLQNAATSLAPPITSAITIRWRTNLATTSKVWFGIEEGSLTNSVENAELTTEHEVRLSGLVPDKGYFYAIGSAGGPLAGDPSHAFFTPPPRGSREPFRVWVLGDSGTANAGAEAVRDAYTAFNGTGYTDMWLMLGDNAYNNGTDAEFQRAVFDIYPDMLRQSPLWSTLGNHDYYTQSGTPYFDIHTFPTQGEAGGVFSGTEKYYSFDYGNVHFICLDSMSSDRSTTGPMATWLKQDLESTVQEWIIAFWHHPPYTFGSHNSDNPDGNDGQSVQMRENFLPLLEAGGVDLVLGGHSHSYERSYLLNGHYGSSNTFAESMKKAAGTGRAAADGTGAYLKPDGPLPAANQGAVYAVAGSSGKATNWWGGSTALVNPNPHPAMIVSLLKLGSMVLDVHDTRLDVKFLSSIGSVDDEFTILKSVPNQPPSVTLTSPTKGQRFTTGATVRLAATATDPDGTISQVGFYQGSNFLRSDSSEPYELDWTPATAGTYTLTAAAQDNLGATSSTTVTISVDPVPPVAPTGLVAIPGILQVTLTWNRSTGADSYSVFRSAASPPAYEPLQADANPTDTTYTDGTAALGVSYSYVVRATNAAGTSEFSDAVSATPMAPPTLPSAPSDLKAIAFSKSQINLTWTDNSSNETGFKIEQKSGKNSWSVIATTRENATAFAATGLGAGKTVTYRVRATNLAGDSAASNEASATTPRR